MLTVTDAQRKAEHMRAMLRYMKELRRYQEYLIDLSGKTSQRNNKIPKRQKPKLTIVDKVRTSIAFMIGRAFLSDLPHPLLYNRSKFLTVKVTSVKAPVCCFRCYFLNTTCYLAK